MASHKDTDAALPELMKALAPKITDKSTGEADVYQRLQDRGVEMVKNQLSTIAAGNQTDEILFEKQNGKVIIKRLPDDLDCLRISIGEVNSQVREKYLTLRGDPRRARKLLHRMIREIDAAIASGM